MNKQTDQKRTPFSELRLLVIASLLLSALSYLNAIFLANAMGPDTFGQYSYALVLGALFGQWISFGTVEAGIRLHATFGKQALDWVLTLRAFNFALLIIAALIVSMFGNESTIFLGVIVALNSLSLTTHYESQGQNVRYMTIYLVERLAITVSIWMILYIADEQYLLWTFAALLIVQIVSLLWQYGENRHFSIRLNWSGLTTTYKFGFFILVFELSKFAYGGVTRLVIFNKLGNESLGTFATAWQFVPLATLYLAQTTKAWRYRLTETLDDRNLVRFRKELVGLCSVILLPMAIGCCILFLAGDWIIGVIYIESYHAAGDLVKYLAIYIIVVALDSILVLLAIAAGLVRLVGIVYVVFGGLTALVTLFMLDGLGTGAYLTTIILGHLGAVVALSIVTIKALRKLF